MFKYVGAILNSCTKIPNWSVLRWTKNRPSSSITVHHKIGTYFFDGGEYLHIFCTFLLNIRVQLEETLEFHSSGNNPELCISIWVICHYIFSVMILITYLPAAIIYSSTNMMWDYMINIWFMFCYMSIYTYVNWKWGHLKIYSSITITNNPD